MIVKGFLVVRADGDLRVVKKQPRLGADEVAFPVTVNMPARPWGAVQRQDIEVTLPGGPEPKIRIGEPQTPEVLEPIGDET